MRIRAQIATTLAAACLLGTCLAVSPAGAASPPLESQLLALVQQQRARYGLPPLIVSAGLTRAAENWSDHELAMGTIAHNPNPGSFLAPFWQRWGENVGVGPNTGTVIAMFMNSAPHRANILGDYNRIGIGLSVRGDGSDFVTVDFEKFPPGV